MRKTQWSSVDISIYLENKRKILQTRLIHKIGVQWNDGKIHMGTKCIEKW